VDSIWLLVVSKGRDRLCAAQIWFQGGERYRDYLILHHPAHANGAGRTEGGWAVRSLATAAKVGSLDLRNPKHALRLEKALSALDPATDFGDDAPDK
jgi:hypothetical protein